MYKIDILKPQNKLNTTYRESNWQLPLGIAILACTIIYVSMELKYPHFFMRGDNADWYTAEYYYSFRCILEGKFPLYCFNEFCGQRYFASGQSGVLNPLISIAAILSLLLFGKIDCMIDILAYMSIILGCIGSFFLLKKLGCSRFSTIIGSIAWNFNCYNIWEGTGWILVIYTTSLFPYFLLTSLLLQEKSCVKNRVLAIIPRVYLLYLGHPQFFIFGAIFDCIFTVFIILFKYRNNRLIGLLELVKNYLIVYVSVAIISAPLLIPEFQYIQESYGYGSYRSFDNLTAELGYDRIAFLFPFLYTQDNITLFYPPFIGYFLSVFLIISLFLPILLIQKNRNPKLTEIIRTILSTLPCLIGGFILLFYHDIYKVIKLIPILNRFQYYHRIAIYYSGFEVILSCLSLTAFSIILQHKIKFSALSNGRLMSMIKLVLISLVILFNVLLYTCTPHIGRGVLFNTTNLYDMDFAKQFSNGRYLTLGFQNDPRLINMKNYDLSENISYNLNKLYNINNVSGYIYDVISSDVLDKNEYFNHSTYFNGSLFECYPCMIEQMREQSVNWYIVSPDKKTVFEEYTKDYALKLVSESDYSIVYYDSLAQPYAYDSEGNEVNLVQDVNSLILNTESNFQGGDITLNYTYDPNFKCYIDGKETTIRNEPDKWQFIVNCEPAEHEIIIQYEDNTFFVCLIFTCTYIVLSVTGIIINKQIRKRKTIRHV